MRILSALATIALAAGVPAAAQNAPAATSIDPTSPGVPADNDSDFPWGLLGLIGLAGLFGRKRDDNRRA